MFSKNKEKNDYEMNEQLKMFWNNFDRKLKG